MDLVNKLKQYKIKLFILASTIVHAIIGGTLNLTDDEAYYWVWSEHLDISYFDHPPLVAYLIKFFTSILGDTNLAVRLPGVLAITVCSIYIYKIIMYLYNDRQKAFLGVAIFNLLPLFSMAAVMTIPDLPLIMFYTISLYYFIRLIYEQNSKLWYLIGILVGLGLLSKYNMVLIYPGIFFYLLLTKENRFWFKRKEPYLAFFLSLLFFLPVIIWNMQHDWASFAFQFYSRHSKKFEIKFHLFTQFLVSQLLVVSPILFVGMFKRIKEYYQKRDVQLLLFYGAPIFLVFLAASFITKFKIHWAAMAYIPFLIILVVYTDWNKFWRFAGIGFAVLLTLFIYTQSYYPIVKIKPKQDITTDMHGWDQVGVKVQKIYNQVNKENWFLFSHRYQVTSQLSFYLPNKEYVYSLTEDIEQYDFWQNENKLKGKNGIFVAHTFYNQDPAKAYKFDQVELIKKINIKRAGIVYRTFYIYKCYNYRGLK